MFNSFALTQQDFIRYAARIFIIFLILPLHEFAHAWTAHRLGDDTAKYQGRLTLNPIAHVDPIGALLLLLTGYGWAKPVPIDPTRFSRKHSIRFGVAVTALAGPLSNLLAALVGEIVLQFYMISGFYQTYLAEAGGMESISDAPYLVYYFLYYFIAINIGLAVFNLVPIPPLDGSKVLSYFTSARVDDWFRRNSQVVRIVFLIVVITGLLSLPLSIVSGWIQRFFRFITSWIPALFG